MQDYRGFRINNLQSGGRGDEKDSHQAEVSQCDAPTDAGRIIKYGTKIGRLQLGIIR
jgi:hypothetical protein